MGRGGETYEIRIGSREIQIQVLQAVVIFEMKRERGRERRHSPVIGKKIVLLPINSVYARMYEIVYNG